MSDIRQYTQFYLKNQLDAHNSQYYPRCVKNHWESCHLTFFVRKEDIMRKLAFCFVAVAVSFDGFAVIDFDTPKVGEYKFQINRTANRDTSATLNMAWGVTFN